VRDARCPQRSDWAEIYHMGELVRTTCVECGSPFSEDDPASEERPDFCESCVEHEVEGA